MSRITAVNEGRSLLDQLDLNLLRVFDALMRERRVGRAAESLGLSQPAVSNALARLRRTLGDPVFVRSATGLAPTAAAERLAEAVGPALLAVRAALAPTAPFLAAQSARSFTLGLSDIGEIYFLPRLMPALRDQAPGIRLTARQPDAGDLQAALESGAMDLAVGHLPTMPGRFRQRRLFEQRYVCLLRAGHPLLARAAGTTASTRARLSLRDYQAADHLVVVSAGTGHGLVEDVLRRKGVARRVALTVPHFVASGHILAATDLLATVPERLAACIAPPFGLVSLNHPVDLPRSPITMVWHERAHSDQGQQWLRNLVVDLFAAARSAETRSQ